MAELFLIGTFWFWALVIASWTLLVLLVESENGIWSTVVFVGTLLLLQFLGNSNIIGLIIANPWATVGIIALNFVCGTVWGIHKWRMKIHDRIDLFYEVKANWLAWSGLSGPNVPLERQADWEAYLKGQQPGPGSLYVRERDLDKPPLARDHKARILTWMTWWLPSLFASFFNDFIRGIYKSIYRRIVSHLQNIANNAYSKVEKDLPTKEG